ncbi:MerR family transcriptional regulator [Nocardia beijingensis]|uniref:MerR family transcriptional regulator n=1 Tax=Nocardia beijingensis TaxID=95162 RepID=UPI001895B146|nr:MerR family transcriptional regulator [Nocardia beijingensis]MBF6465346.1 MerR family transcriptional regulator [Nocardia beijingensis]
MTATVPIGEFSRLSNLSVKTLRYYHEIGLLAPVGVDASSGYRRYATTQVSQAQLIRRLRELDMPVPEIRAVLAAPDENARDATLRAHLERMEAELARTRAVVASLRALLTPSAPISVEYRAVAAFPAAAIGATVAREHIDEWCAATFQALYEALAAADITPAGVGGATYGTDFFEHDEGAVVAFVPLADAEVALPAELSAIELPARRFAVAVHEGPFEDFDRTYGALGSHVAEHDVALAEPIREMYLVGPDVSDDPATYRTEVCWPIAQP